MKQRTLTSGFGNFFRATLIVITIIGCSGELRLLAQSPGEPVEQENFVCGKRDFTPGNFVTLPSTFRTIQQGEKSGMLIIRSIESGETWRVPVETPEPRRLNGFTVPQLPKGAYTARLEGAEDSGNGQDFSFTVSPRMQLVPGKMWAQEGDRLQVKIEIVGPAAADLKRRIELTLQSNDASDLNTGSVQESHTIETQEPASFNLEVKRCPFENFTVTAPGFAPLNFKISCKQPSPIPVVFVPGTAGSELDLPDGSVYWIDLGTLAPGALDKGRLDENGKDKAGAQITPSRPLSAITVPLSRGAAARLRFIGIESNKVLCKKTTDKGPCWAFKSSIYEDFLKWARQNFDSQGGARNFLEAAYDWRKGIGPETRERIGAVVQEALKNSPDHKEVIIIAHSLGGLVSRDYIAEDGQGQVAALIAAGTPWLGAPKATRGLIWGYNFGVGTAIDIGRYTKLKGLDRKVENPLSLSLLDLKKAKALAQGWPAVFQQLPATDFMRLYGPQMAGDRSIVFGWTPQQTMAFYNKINPRLYGETIDWRACHLFAKNDYGTPHYLIAGFENPVPRPSETMDMEMIASQSQVQRSRAGKILKQVARKLTGITSRLLTGTLGLFLDNKDLKKVKIYPDDYIAVETGAGWGDGTSPLLSASAGAQIKKDAAKYDNIAQQYLGAATQVNTMELSPGFNHGSMLDDPKVRWNIWRIYREQNRAIGVSVNPEIATIEIELKWEILNPAEKMKFILGENDLVCQPKSQETEPTELGVTLSCVFKHSDSKGVSAGGQQTPRMNDLIGKTLQLQLSPKGMIRLKEVRLIVNEMEIFNYGGNALLTNTGQRFNLNLPLEP
jgi:pimeloyl-ACP methyl ester carboxylesterase